MKKSGNIVRYSEQEIDEMLARGESKTNWEKVDALTSEEIEASIDFEEEGEFDWSRATTELPLPKRQLTLRLDPVVLNFFKSGGPGYQTRINAVLRSYVEAQKKAS